jgi:hypothetical protein
MTASGQAAEDSSAFPSRREQSRAMSRAWPADGEPSSSLGVSTTTGTPALREAIVALGRWGAEQA